MTSHSADSSVVRHDEFDPPADHTFEPEFSPAAPRPIPPELYRGRLARRRRRSTLACLLSGLLCVGCAQLPIVKHWGLYFVPFEDLAWIGLVVIALPPLGRLVRLFRPDPYRYVREGVPLLARIRAVALVPTATHNGQPTTYRFVASIEYAHPTTGEPAVADVASSDVSALTKDLYTTTYNVGDRATAVYLPRDPAAPVQLYGFLDLRPNLGVVRRQAKPDNPFALAGVIIALFAFFAALFWNVYAFGQYQPLDLTFRQGVWPFAAGAVLLGGAALALLAWEARRVRRKRDDRNRAALATGGAVEFPLANVGLFGVQGIFIKAVVILGSFLLGGATMLCWAYTANALLDDSPAEFRPVRIAEMIRTTSHGVFREYEIKYHFPGEPNHSPHTLTSTPDHMALFHSDDAIAELHAGRFGWRWVKTLHPGRFTTPRK